MEDKIKKVEDNSTTEITHVEQSTESSDAVEQSNASEDTIVDDVPKSQEKISNSVSSTKKEKGPTATSKAMQKDTHTVKCEQLAKQYGKSYPDHSEFHITSDYQVFLSDNKSHALNHQRMQNSGELVTIKIK